MSKANDAWGIEIGSNALKAVRLVKKGTEVTLADYELLPFKKVLTSPDLNVAEAIQVNLDQFLSRHNVSRSTVVVSVPGHMAFARFAKLPPVEPKRIPDIVRFEAVQQIPFPIEEVEWDYQIFSQPDSPDVEVGIFAITKERLADILANYNAVGLTVDGLTLSPLAVYNGLAHDLNLDEESAGVIFMDIGTTSTDVIIVEGGNLWLRTLPIGGNNFTEALVRSFKLSFPKAEKLKREAGTSKYARQIFQAMRPVFADLVQEMQRSLGFYQSLNRDAKLSKLVGVGSTFRLPGMAKFLKQQLQLDVVRPDGFEGVTIDTKLAADLSEHAINMATAYGLALQGLGIERVDANILPRDILKKRVWRAKQPWVGLAAALMIVASGIAWGRLSMEQASYDEAFKNTDPQIARVINEAKSLQTQFRQVETNNDPRDRINRLRGVLALRDLWPMLLEDINHAVLSLNPQQAIVEGDWEKVRRIPREERRIVHIDSIETVYLYEKPTPMTLWTGGGGVRFTGAAARSGGAGGMMGGPGDMMMGGPMGGPGGPDMGGGPMMGPGMGMPGMGQGGGATAAASGPENPTFEITLRGYTPYHPNTPQFLEKGIVQWLKDSSLLPSHQGRPYRIRPDSRGIESITPVMSQSATDRSRTGTSGGRSGVIPGLSGAGRAGGGGGRTSAGGMRAIGGGGTPMMDMGGPGGMDGPGGPGAMMGGGGGFFGNTGTRSAGAGSGVAFLPEPPDSGEPRDRDQAFVIVLRVELLPPNESGQDQQGGGPQAGDTSPTDKRRSRTDQRPGMTARMEEQS
jgi:type IV pilus assembly protein PilM